MGTVAFAAPLLPGKTEAWRQWIGELNGTRASDLADFNKRHGLTRHAAWLQATPMGDFAVVLHEGPGADGLLPKMAASDHEFDQWFVGNVKELHGLDLATPPPPPEPVLDAHS